MKVKGKSTESDFPANTFPVSNFYFVSTLTYVALVLTVDTLAVRNASWPFDWSVFQWRAASLWHCLRFIPPDWISTPPINHVDMFKLVFWFLIPFLISLHRMEWSWLSPRDWKRNDWLLLGGMIALGAIAIISIPLFPTLRATYPGMAHLPAETRWLYCISYLFWTLSWLPGWEFLHRYFLLRIVMMRFPRFGWLIVPLSETVYHLQKPLLEAAGMLIFSLLLTWWSVKHRNMLLPFLAHLYVEITLLTALIFFL